MKRRFKKYGLPLILAIIVTVPFATIFLNKTFRTSFDTLDETDQEMLTELARIYESFRTSSDELWTEDYRFDTEPLILVRSNKDQGFFAAHAYAINVPELATSVFTKKIDIPPDMQLPPIYRINQLHLGVVPWVPWNFGTRNIADENVFYFKYHPDMFKDPPLYFQFPYFLLHETFHEYKQPDWVYDRKGSDRVMNYPVNEENYALMGIEFKLLDAALAASRPEDARIALRQWTIVRTYRYGKWPELIAETNAEAIEGSARYLEYRYSQLTDDTLTVLATPEPPYHIQFIDAFNFIANGEADSPAFLERGIRYETGAALGLTLDRLELSWKKDIEDHAQERGKTQYELLRTYFDISIPIDEHELEEIKTAHDYEALLEKARKIVALASKGE